MPAPQPRSTHMPGMQFVREMGGYEYLPDRRVEDEFQALDSDEQALVRRVIEERARSKIGASPTLGAMEEIQWAERPVDPETFLTDPRYLGGIGQYLYPIWLDRLCRILDDDHVTEVILSGAIGNGKSFVVTLGICYELYRLLCMRNPQELFGNAAGTAIVLTALSVTGANVKNVSWAYVDGAVRQSTYFREHRTPYKNTLWWPAENVAFRAGSSTESSIIGENVMGGVLDECFDKNSLVTIERDGVYARLSVGDLYAMQDRSSVRLVGYDHSVNNLGCGAWDIRRSGVRDMVRIETEDGRVVSRWRPTWGERLRLLLGWPVWMHVTGAPPPPVALDVQRTPFIAAREARS